MTVHSVELEPKPVHKSFRLTRGTSATAVSSSVRPALVLPEREGRALLAEAAREDIACGGVFSAGPAGIQVWSGPWVGAGGSRGDAVHLGSVDWSYDTPVRHYLTIYRVLVTVQGVAAGLTTSALLDQVLALAGVSSTGDRADMAPPPARDPFRTQR